MAAYPPTNLPPECTQSNCGSGLARESGLTADQSPTECTRQIVGAGLPAMAAYPPTNLPPECTQSNCGSEPARESGLTADQSPTECTRSNGGSWLPARTAYKPTTSHLNAHIPTVGASLLAKAACQTPSKLQEQSRFSTHTINAPLQSRLKYTNRYAITATTPCAVTYGYARIRRLTRLWVGLYRFPVTENQ